MVKRVESLFETRNEGKETRYSFENFFFPIRKEKGERKRWKKWFSIEFELPLLALLFSRGKIREALVI